MIFFQIEYDRLPETDKEKEEDGDRISIESSGFFETPNEVFFVNLVKEYCKYQHQFPKTAKLTFQPGK